MKLKAKLKDSTNYILKVVQIDRNTGEGVLYCKKSYRVDRSVFKMLNAIGIVDRPGVRAEPYGSGSLIGGEGCYVLTARHVGQAIVEESNKQDENSKEALSIGSEFRFRVGQVDNISLRWKLTKYSKSGKVVALGKIQFNDEDESTYSSDYMIFKLDSKIDCQKIRPIELGNFQVIDEGGIYVAGFANVFPSDKTDNLKSGSVSRANGPVPASITDGMQGRIISVQADIATLNKGFPDSVLMLNTGLPGDSGGPILQWIGDRPDDKKLCMVGMSSKHWLGLKITTIYEDMQKNHPDVLAQIRTDANKGQW
jgi:hypothetical protein